VSKSQSTSSPARPRLDERAGPAVPLPLLFSRAETARLLSRSIASVIRMEQAGLLEVVKFSESPHARAYYRADQVRALADGSRR
jgi:hypothetical protein